ncbi:rhodanese-like domain-containing protein [Halorubrum laminariae]|uniref:Rhodanese-like domain-containing protein n=1 Tax=Halorubrum laminariae TaxID=1433523 RepID=A0ABD6C259_9EURY|nr:rhodanese-like domain-containing protein [Halorubrum laminariae]
MVAEIDPDDLASLPDDERDEIRIVDIRDRRAFDRGHVPGSECIPFPELSTRITELAGASRIVTVCPHGIASQQAAQLIGTYADAQDARVESLRGGIEAWQRDAGELVATSQEGDADERGDVDCDAESGGDCTDDPDGGNDEGPAAPF